MQYGICWPNKALLSNNFSMHSKIAEERGVTAGRLDPRAVFSHYKSCKPRLSIRSPRPEVERCGRQAGCQLFLFWRSLVFCTHRKLVFIPKIFGFLVVVHGHQ